MKKPLLLLLTVIGFFLLPVQSKAQQIGRDIQLKWQLLDPQYQGKSNSLTQLTLINKSDFHIPNYGWELFFSNMRMIDTNSVHGDFKLTFINGDLYSLSPTAQFDGLESGDSVKINFIVSSRIPNFTDAPEGFYISSNLVSPSVQAVNPVQLLPYHAPEEKNKAFLQALYEKNERISSYATAQSYRIIPAPENLSFSGKQITLNRNLSVQGNERFVQEMETLRKELSGHFNGLSAGVDAKTSIRFSLLEGLEKEEYELQVTEEGIEIKATHPAGAFYAVQSLIALFPKEYYSQPGQPFSLPSVQIKDKPRLGYRGLMLDMARNFHGKESVMQVIKLMASYKLNTLHLHMIDDEGWRIEIKSLPQLTEVGSKRDAFYQNGKSLQPSYGSGAFAKPKQYLTQQEFIEIIKFAADHHIQVIPEIETPGHGRAAIYAMDYAARQGKASPIHNENDTSRYSSAQYWTDNVMDVGLSATFSFMEQVIDEFIAMYEAAGLRLTTIHMGGDELPTGAWTGSPSIQALMKEKKIESVHQVWAYYVQKLVDIAKTKGLTLAGWEELGMINNGKGMEPNPAFSDKNIQLDVWNNVIGQGHEDLAYRLANMGYPVIYTSANNLYLDMASLDTYNEPGHNWAANVDLERTFGFMIHNFMRSIPEATAKNKSRLTPEGRKNIIGIKGALWAEKIKTPEQQQLMLIPRIFALAERAWSPQPEWEAESTRQWQDNYFQDWASFATWVGNHELPKLEMRWNQELNYRLPAVGVKEIGGKVHCNLELPGFIIVYTTDGSEPQAGGKVYQEPIAEKGILKFKVFSPAGKSSYTTRFQHN